MSGKRRRHPPACNAQARGWDAVTRLGQFTLPELMVEADITEDDARVLLRKLRQGGHIRRAGRRIEIMRRLHVWRLVKDPGPAFLLNEGGLRAPRSRAWASMRRRGTFKVADVVATQGISAANCDKYVRALLAVGYLVVSREKDNGRLGGAAEFMLVKNTGPEAPLPYNDGTVYDPNLNKVVGRHDLPAEPPRNIRQARAWAEIRRRRDGGFTVAEIQAAAGLSEDGTRRYLWALARAGWIHGSRVGAGGAPGHRTVYRLAVDPGPLAPRLMRDGRVLNPNDGLTWGAAE